MSNVVEVDVLPTCDFCGPGGSEAVYDAKTQLGPWAFMCDDHWGEYGVGRTGTGYGQRLHLRGTTSNEDRYTCPNADHTDCFGPTGVHRPAQCEVCGTACYSNTCWQSGQRVPSTTPVLCAACTPQGVLL